MQTMEGFQKVIREIAKSFVARALDAAGKGYRLQEKEGLQRAKLEKQISQSRHFSCFAPRRSRLVSSQESGKPSGNVVSWGVAEAWWPVVQQATNLDT